VLRSVRSTVDVRRADGTFVGHESTVDRREPPYETRVVFATYRGGRLAPVTDVENYRGALGPGDVSPRL
jgi:hypothetical protein